MKFIFSNIIIYFSNEMHNLIIDPFQIGNTHQRCEYKKCARWNY